MKNVPQDKLQASFHNCATPSLYFHFQGTRIHFMVVRYLPRLARISSLIPFYWNMFWVWLRFFYLNF